VVIKFRQLNTNKEMARKVRSSGLLRSV